MMSDAYARGLPEALRRGLVGMADIDASVRRVLALKERLGLFDDPYRRGAAGAGASGRRDAERRELAREVARRAIVLLTCARGALPLSPEIRRIALVGPLAAAPREMLGPWAVGGPRRGGRVHPGRGSKPPCPNAGSTAPRASISARDDTRGIAAARRSVPRRRRGRALPRRGRFDERRGGESRRSRPAGTPARPRRGGSRSRQARRGAALFGPPARRCRGSSSARTRFSPRGFSASRPATPSPTF